MQAYLVLVPSSFFSIGAPSEGLSAGAFISPAGAAGSAGAGAAGAGAGGGGGGAGSSFLPHPAKVSIKAKSVVPDIKTILFPILSSPPFPTQLWKTVLLDNFYCTSPAAFQGDLCVKSIQTVGSLSAFRVPGRKEKFNERRCGKRHRWVVRTPSTLRLSNATLIVEDRSFLAARLNCGFNSSVIGEPFYVAMLRATTT
jgi:hypothetical protein